MGDGRPPPATEVVDVLIPPTRVAGVHETKLETEPVTLARLRYETIRFNVVTVTASVIVLAVALFLMAVYGASAADAQSKIVGALVSVLSAAVGVIVGRRL